MIDYKKYRWFLTSRKTRVVGGKNALQNDELLKNVLATGNDYYVMHTSSPGSPFAVLLKEPSKVTKQELDECAQFTACFSQAWKARKKTTRVDIFRSKQLSKDPRMKAGMWRVQGAIDRTNVTLELALTKQGNTLRAVPIQSAKKKLMHVIPGTIDKSDMAAQLGVELGDAFTRDEIVAALPAGGVKKKV